MWSPPRNSSGGVSVDNQLRHIEEARRVNPYFFERLEGSTNGPLPPPQLTIGWIWANWIETNCRLGEGDLYGQPPRLDGTQRALLWKLGELDPETLDLRFSFALISFSKGGGKTPFGGWMGALDLDGPRVPTGKFMPHPEYGYLPTAKKRISPDVINMASSYEQADLILDEMRTTFEKGPSWRAREWDSRKGTIESRGGRGKARRIPATPKKADGSKATTLLVDEMHEFEGERQERAYDVASGGTAKRQNGLTLIMSTAGWDLESLYGRLVARFKRGKFDKHELGLILEAPIGLDPYNDQDIAKGILFSNPLAKAGISNVTKLVSKFKSMPVASAKRYYWNQWTPSSESWLPEGAWDACRGEWVVNAKFPTWFGVDMAKSRDSAAIVILQYRHPDLGGDGRYQARAEIWRATTEEEAEDEEAVGVIDQAEIDKRLMIMAKESHKALEWIAGDPAYWAGLPKLEKTKAAWAEHKDGLLPVFRMPQQGQNMVHAYTQLYQKICNQELVHDGNPEFADQITSAVPHSTDRGWTLKKSKTNRKIDCCPALASAIFASTQEREREIVPMPAAW